MNESWRMPGRSIRWRPAPLFAAAAILAAGARAIPALGVPARSAGPVPAATPTLPAALTRFLAFAHPAQDGCPGASDVTLLQAPAAAIRARYRPGCGPESLVEGFFSTRSGPDGEPQIYAGFELPAGAIDAFLKAASRRRSAPGGVDLPLVQPEQTGSAEPRFPEDAERLWLTGSFTVEMVVDVAADGAATRALALTGPDPDHGFRQAGVDAALAVRYRPATFAGKPVRCFQPIMLQIAGLPEESASWLRRSLVRIEGLVAGDAAPLLEARARLDAGDDFAAVTPAPGSAGNARSVDWGYILPEALSDPLRRALEGVRPGGFTGPVAADGAFHLVKISGEVSYGIRPAADGRLEYVLVHHCGGLDADGAARVVESDIADYVAASRRDAYVREAQSVMGQRMRRIELERLLVHTDALDDAEIDILRTVLDETSSHHQIFWSPISTPRAIPGRIAVYAFARTRDHDRLYRDWHAGRMDGALATLAGRAAKPAAAPAWNPAGEYLPSSRILGFSCEDLDGHLPVPIAIHELVHMLNHETVYGEGVEPSTWFEEGLASYFALSRLGRDLTLEPGVIAASGRLKQGDKRVRYDPRAFLQDYKRGVQSHGPVDLAALLASHGNDRLWTELPERMYGASWSLVHFLLHGDGSAYARRFQEYARLEAHGKGGTAAFASVFGADLGALETAWHAHEKEM